MSWPRCALALGLCLASVLEAPSACGQAAQVCRTPEEFDDSDILEVDESFRIGEALLRFRFEVPPDRLVPHGLPWRVTLESPSGTSLLFAFLTTPTNHRGFDATFSDEGLGHCHAAYRRTDATDTIYNCGTCLVAPMSCLGIDQRMSAFDGELSNGTWELSLDPSGWGEEYWQDGLLPSYEWCVELYEATPVTGLECSRTDEGGLSLAFTASGDVDEFDFYLFRRQQYIDPTLPFASTMPDPSSEIYRTTKQSHEDRGFVRFDKSSIEMSIPALFERQVRVSPRRTAVACERQLLSYDDLNRISNRIAHAILRRRGAKGEPIALLFRQPEASVPRQRQPWQPPLGCSMDARSRAP